jgi:hypothetical protein
MWVRETDRRELIEFLQSDRWSHSSAKLFPKYEYRPVTAISPSGTQHELLLIWEDDPRDRAPLPDAIVTLSSLRDFLAWSTTYVSVLRPLSAYTRICDLETARQALRLNSVPKLGRLESICAGLILGETATHISGRRDLSDIPVLTCAGTHSFVLSRAVSLGNFQIEELSKAWFSAREMTSQPPLALRSATLLSPWRLLISLESSEQLERGIEKPASLIVELCRDLFLKGEIDARKWLHRESELSAVNGLFEALRGPREDRIVALDELIARLKKMDSLDAEISTFLIAYFASQISPGTLDHLQLLFPHLEAFPGVLIWYGMCAGMYQDSTISSFAGGLGKRVMREVLRPETFLSRPICDVSISELQMMLSRDRGATTFRTYSTSHLELELQPCVVGAFRWPPRGGATESLFGSTVIANPEIDRLIDGLRDASSLISGVISKVTDWKHGADEPPRRQPKRRQQS